MRNVYSVAQVNSYIKNMFTQDFMLTSIYIKGEVSNCKYHTSGHIYFTLKDEKGTMPCVMFAGSRTGLKFRLEEGQQVIVLGSIDVYERDGRYQLYAKEIILEGAGALYERFEALKKELEEMGMFEKEYKQPIPKYIKVLGVVTAPTGAAIQDIINISARRNPYVQIILYPAIVQGENAAKSIVNGIHALEQKNVDVMIVGRGGGSLEDLWAFNERVVAEAIFDCQVPIISAVGHETDTTIADYVADLRAPTPSAGAELAVFEVSQLFDRIGGYREILNRQMNHRLEDYRNRQVVSQRQLRLLSPMNQLKQKRTYAISLEERLQESIKGTIVDRKHQFEVYVERLKGLSPLDKLNQGFSYVSDDSGHTLTDVNQIQIGEVIQVHVRNGQLQAAVTDKKKIRRDS